MWRKEDRMYGLFSTLMLCSSFCLTITDCFQTNVAKIARFPESLRMHGMSRLQKQRYQYLLHQMSSTSTKTALSVGENYEDKEESLRNKMTRRTMLQGIACLSSAYPLSAVAGQAEVDSSGMRYSPKSEMLSGGSQAARGIPIDNTRSGRLILKPGQALQSVYGTRFITYLSRFLLNFDPSAKAWGVNNGLVENASDRTLAANKFAEFAESVEVGLADYFVGPYGSYSSVSAAKAGLNAAAPVRSAQPLPVPTEREFLLGIFKGKPTNIPAAEDLSKAKQGVLNLLALLKARYTSIDAKKQLSILFSLIPSPGLQPTAEIKSLLGEIDNATISEINILRPLNVVGYRTSSRYGGGYSFDSNPRVEIEPPPALGDAFKLAKLRPNMKPTSRILRIEIVDGGEGYTSAPQVVIQQSRFNRPCQACAIMDRRGHVESILVLDPGYGYREEKNGIAPKVYISPPPKIKGEKTITRQALALAELEYEISSIDVVEGGNGYVASEPPRIYVSPPESDPDWFLERPTFSEKSTNVSYGLQVQASAAVLPRANDNVTYGSIEKPESYVGSWSINELKKDESYVGGWSIDELKKDQLKLLPSSNRPLLQTDPSTGATTYMVPNLPAAQQMKIPSPRYRAFDAVFGGVGSVPVTKGAAALSASEYGRLALSGAVCTVLVRTLLNPLELIKTKQQLENDEELFAFARQRMSEQNSEASASIEDNNRVNVISDQSSLQCKKPAKLAESSSKQPMQVLCDENSSVVLENSEKALTHEPIQVITRKHENTSLLETQTESDVSASGDIQTNSDVSINGEIQPKVGVIDVISSLVALRGPLALFQSADITLLASLVFGSFGFGATELFRRYFTAAFFTGDTAGSGVTLLLAAGLATVLTSAAASPFEVLRVRSMGLLESKKWTAVLQDFLKESQGEGTQKNGDVKATADDDFKLTDLNPRDVIPLFSGFAPILSRELPFSIAKFLTFDFLAQIFIGAINNQSVEGALPVQVGVGPTGLAVSATAGALAGIAGAIVSHPSDLILTFTSASKKKESPDASSANSNEIEVQDPNSNNDDAEWLKVLKDLISREGGIANLFLGLPARATFFFLVIGLQFFLYDYVKSLFQVGIDDLDLLLDVFYAVRAGLL